jgi:hypothetical protein
MNRTQKDNIELESYRESESETGQEGENERDMEALIIISF